MSLSPQEQEILDALEMDLRRSDRFGRRLLRHGPLRLRHRLHHNLKLGAVVATLGLIVMLWQLASSVMLSFGGFLLILAGLWMSDAANSLSRTSGRFVARLRDIETNSPTDETNSPTE